MINQPLNIIFEYSQIGIYNNLMQTNKLNISSITKLSSFISKYPDESLHNQLKSLQQSFPSYRAIKGDGNCFYRAFAFLYLAVAPCEQYAVVFPRVQWVCQNSKSIKSNQQFQQTLYDTWNKYIKPLGLAENREIRQKKLQSLFNTAISFDELMIGYFRSFNYHYLMKQKQRFLPFVKNEEDFKHQLKRVVTFNQQSEQIEIYSLTFGLEIRLIVFFIDSNNFQPIQYMEGAPDKSLYLFYRIGHYDIIYPEFSKNEQKHMETKSAFSNIKEHYINREYQSPLTKKQGQKGTINSFKNVKQQRVTSMKQVGSQISVKEEIYEQKNSGSSKLVKKITNFYTTSGTGEESSKYDVKYSKFGQNSSKISQKIGNKKSQQEQKAGSSELKKQKLKQKPKVVGSNLNLLQKLWTQSFAVVGISALAYVLYTNFV